ncbi:hypothetical protein [Marinobacter changyiensis]|uniref:hypothetical protein n=1 Tax=Marinobacter changyiensis TaxID=2604091 RepID=UPI001264BBE9|nr:hypothetical protein [Marinobacter changyiensis]
MRDRDVPQDRARSLGGQRKRLYARDESGRYTTVLSSGWEAEEVVLGQAVDEFRRQAAEARQRVKQGLSSPLEYHMYARRMDLTVLAQASGLFRWQVRRHLKPSVFRRLPTTKLTRYQQALQLGHDELTCLPPDHEPSHD